MEVDNVYNMCRLCLYRSDNLIDIFEISARHGCIAAEVITDLLRFQVAKEDGYPHVICSRCLDKLNEFKVFKEVCQSLKTTYDNLFSKRRVPVHSQQQMEVVEVLPVKMERIEEEISEEASCHRKSLANEDFITDDTPSELELMRVKAEPDDSLDIEENDPEAMYVPAKARMGEPVSENVDIYPEVSSQTYTDEDEAVMQHDPMQMSSAPADSNQAGFPETCKPQAYHRGPETQEQCQKRARPAPEIPPAQPMLKPTSTKRRNSHYPCKVPRNEKQRHLRRKCRVCKSEGRRTDTLYFCEQCPGQPALCLESCFSRYHDDVGFKRKPSSKGIKKAQPPPEIPPTPPIINSSGGRKTHFPCRVPRNDRNIPLRRKCLSCKSEGRRVDTAYYCDQCPGRPALCILPCFPRYHNDVRDGR